MEGNRTKYHKLNPPLAVLYIDQDLPCSVRLVRKVIQSFVPCTSFYKSLAELA